MFKKVIVGFDGTQQAHDALHIAQSLLAPDGELIVCCVHRFDTLSARIDPVEPRLDSASAQRHAEEAMRTLNGRVTATTELLPAAAVAGGLQHAAERHRADLIVLGSSHRGAIGRVLIGSVGDDVLHSAPCPVLVVPHMAHAAPAQTA